MRLDREEILGIVGVLVHTMDFGFRASQDEVVFIKRFLERVGVSARDRDALIEEARATNGLEGHAARITSRQGRLYAMQQTLLLALSDGEYGRITRAALKRLAGTFSIDDVLFEDLENWALEGADWQIRGAALLAR